MPLSQNDDDFIESKLSNLYDLSIKITGRKYEIVEEYIYVHEFGLALDVLAHIYIQSRKTISPEIQAIFESLALKMGMESGDEWKGVAKIRAK